MRKIKFYNPDGKEIKWPHFFMWFCITSILLIGVIACYGVYVAYGEELQTETRYIYGTCVEADGITSGATDWTSYC